MNIMMVWTVLVASPALGMVYLWRDSAGVAHYTNKEYTTPFRYKAKAKVLYPEASDSGSTQPGTASAQTVPVAQLPANANQNAEPTMLPAAPATQIQRTPPKISESRGRRHRGRSAEEDE